MKEMSKLQWGVVAFLVLATLFSLYLEFFGHHEESHHWWSGIPMFWILFGGIGCAVITVFAKKILGPIIFKKEDYYNE